MRHRTVSSIERIGLAALIPGIEAALMLFGMVAWAVGQSIPAGMMSWHVGVHG